jgi:hypothetical protein
MIPINSINAGLLKRAAIEYTVDSLWVMREATTKMQYKPMSLLR